MAQKLRRQPYHLRKAIKAEVDRLVAEDVIEKVSGPKEWVSNVVAIPKANGKVRVCLDARVINTAIERETYPIPTLDSIIDQMHGAKIFAKLDMKEAYTQLELDEQSRDITCFHTEQGIYRHKRLVYGINNSFEIFQRAMEHSFGVMEGVKFIADDIIIYAKDEKELLKIIRKVFAKIRALGLKLNQSKCVFIQPKIKFFGIEISEKGINADPAKVSALESATPPSNVKELRSFLGLCTYVSRFIPNFSEKTATLRELLKKEVKFTWTECHTKAFNDLKKDLTSDTVLGFYNPQKEVELVTDASDYALGGVLLQKDDKEQSRPICYISKSLSPSEINWGITEKEAYSLVWCIEKLHMYLFAKPFRVIVDHQPLKFLFAPRSKLSPRIARWQLRLQCYDFDVIYKKGSENIADFVSRMNQSDNSSKTETLLKTTNQFTNFVTKTSMPKAMTSEEIKNHTSNDNVLQVLRQVIRTGRWHDNPLVESYKKIKYELSDDNGIILRGDRIVLPTLLQRKAIQLAHEGHLGIEKCKSLLRSKVYWPNMNTMIESFIRNCTACKANSKDAPPEPLKPSELPENVWTEISVDFFGPLPSGEKLLVITDLYSRFPLVEIMRNTNSQAVISHFRKIFTTFGYPARVRTDNGPPFQSDELKNYFKLCDIKHVKITPLHPKSNGTIEKFMQVIKKSIRTATFIGKNWKDALNITLQQYRASEHSTTGRSPASLFLNRELKTKLPSKIMDTKNHHDNEVRERQNIVNEKAKEYHDRKHKAVSRDVKVGDYVILKRLKRPDKFQSKFYNKIYKVIQKNHDLITIEDEQGQRLARNVSYVKVIEKPIPVRNEQTPVEGERKTYPKRNRKQTDLFNIKN